MLVLFASGTFVGLCVAFSYYLFQDSFWVLYVFFFFVVFVIHLAFLRGLRVKQAQGFGLK